MTLVCRGTEQSLAAQTPLEDSATQTPEYGMMLTSNTISFFACTWTPRVPEHQLYDSKAGHVAALGVVDRYKA